MTDTIDPDPATSATPTSTLDQLKQLVGLVEYDESARPVPGDRLGRAWSSSSATPPRPRTTTSPPSGMELVAYSGPETGNRDHKAFVLRSGSCRFVINGGVSPDSPLLDHHRGTATASSTSPSRCPTSTSASPTPGRPAPPSLRGAARRHRRARHRADRRHRDVRRHPAHPGRPRPATPAPYLPGYVARTSTFVKRDGRTQAAASRPSTTSSATSSSARWTSGSRSTTGSWAS